MTAIYKHPSMIPSIGVVLVLLASAFFKVIFFIITGQLFWYFLLLASSVNVDPTEVVKELLEISFY